MFKQITAAILWFYAGWYVGASIALLTGLSSLIGPLVGLGAAVFFAGDPFGIIWTRGKRTAAPSPVRAEIPDVA